jgi:predicted nucleotidyltransferase component of viral defense system
MISVLELRERAREWSLREDIVEKDYVLGWLLWGITSEPALTNTWVFKGGTCLKKCYFETYRFSEDLDFTLPEEAPDEPEALRAIFSAIAERIYEASGLEIPREQIRFDAYQTPRGGRAIEGRVYYRGPRRPGGDLPRIKLDLTSDEVLVYEPIRRPVNHAYTDGLPTDVKPLCYSLPEVFGEKLRALAERCLPRDLYDVISVFRRPDTRGAADTVLDVLQEKCRFKEIAVPTLASIEASPGRSSGPSGRTCSAISCPSCHRSSRTWTGCERCSTGSRASPSPCRLCLARPSAQARSSGCRRPRFPPGEPPCPWRWFGSPPPAVCVSTLAIRARSAASSRTRCGGPRMAISCSSS